MNPQQINFDGMPHVIRCLEEIEQRLCALEAAKRDASQRIELLEYLMSEEIGRRLMESGKAFTVHPEHYLFTPGYGNDDEE